MLAIFFSHSLTTYNTSIEDRCLDALKKRYPDYKIINPRDISMPDDFNETMKCILPLVSQCDMLVWYKDGSYSPGVDMEIVEAHRFKIPAVRLEL